MTKPKIEFPCDYPIKVIAKKRDNLDVDVIAAINPHLKQPFEGNIRETLSKEGNFISLNITLHITDEEELKALFGSLKEVEGVVMVL